jgi:hypothetical protein
VSRALAAEAIALVGGFPVLGSGLRALLVRPVGLAELVVELRQLLAEVPHPVVELGRLLAGVRGVLAGLPRLARRPPGPLLGLGAELLEEPDSLYQSLMLRRVHYAGLKDANPRHVDAMHIAVLDGRIIGVRGRADDRVNRGRLDPKDPAR